MILSKPKQSFIEIDLTGPQGNVFFLIGQVVVLGRHLGFTVEQLESIKSEMTSLNYENAVQTFDRHFGEYVILYR